MFQYAGTVEQTAWNDEQQKKELEVRPRAILSFDQFPALTRVHELQKRIAGLARESTQKRSDATEQSSLAGAFIANLPAASSFGINLTSALHPTATVLMHCVIQGTGQI